MRVLAEIGARGVDGQRSVTLASVTDRDELIARMRFFVRVQ